MRGGLSRRGGSGADLTRSTNFASTLSSAAACSACPDAARVWALTHAREEAVEHAVNAWVGRVEAETTHRQLVPLPVS